MFGVDSIEPERALDMNGALIGDAAIEELGAEAGLTPVSILGRAGDSDRASRGDGKPETKFCSLWGSNEVTWVGETEGLGRAGTGGSVEHMWSPSSDSVTLLPQFEHFTVGNSCDMRPMGSAGDGLS